MSLIPFLLIPLAAYLLPTGLGLWFALFVLKRELQKDVFVSWLTPICLWLILVCVNDRGTLSNFVFEPLILAGVVMLAGAIRIALAGRRIVAEKTLGVLTTSVLLAVAAIIRLLTPALPE